MGAIQNGDFESEGAHAGLAAAWHRVGVRGGSWVTAGFDARDLDVSPITAWASVGSAEWVNTNVDVVPNASVAPDTSPTANRVADEAMDAVHGLKLADPRSFAAGGEYTFGVYVKPSGLGFIALVVHTSVASVLLVADVTAGRIREYPYASGEVDRAAGSVLAIADGWHRVELSFRLSDALTTTPWILLSPDGGAGSYAGTGDGLLLWGAYLTAGARRGFEAHESGWDGGEHASATIAEGEVAEFSVDADAEPPTAAPQESHEGGWSNAPLLTSGDFAAAVFGPGVAFGEGHASGWLGNDAVSFTIQASVAALFAGEPVENYESDWASNESASYIILASEAAVFDGDVPEPYEDHEEAYPDMQYSMDPWTDRFVRVAHGLPDGFSFYVYAQYGGFIPEAVGVNESVRLYVVNRTDDDFQASLTRDGDPVDFSTSGVGMQFVRADPERYWPGSEIV